MKKKLLKWTLVLGAVYVAGAYSVCVAIAYAFGKADVGAEPLEGDDLILACGFDPEENLLKDGPITLSKEELDELFPPKVPDEDVRIPTGFIGRDLLPGMKIRTTRVNPNGLNDLLAALRETPRHI